MKVLKQNKHVSKPSSFFSFLAVLLPLCEASGEFVPLAWWPETSPLRRSSKPLPFSKSFTFFRNQFHNYRRYGFDSKKEELEIEKA
jgi:hypothetical protein